MPSPRKLESYEFDILAQTLDCAFTNGTHRIPYGSVRDAKTARGVVYGFLNAVEREARAGNTDLRALAAKWRKLSLIVRPDATVDAPEAHTLVISRRDELPVFDGMKAALVGAGSRPAQSELDRMLGAEPVAESSEATADAAERPTNPFN